jgi:hypothetical protein
MSDQGKGADRRERGGSAGVIKGREQTGGSRGGSGGVIKGRGQTHWQKLIGPVPVIRVVMRCVDPHEYDGPLREKMSVQGCVANDFPRHWAPNDRGHALALLHPEHHKHMNHNFRTLQCCLCSQARVLG